ncbi:MAG: hypothetical protein A2293_01905 [Elusimicrobia bacterium RIFOXYB2_FULL_49_7]|nr:MAG: hypothetical protein A2293_01905 [Elusimicrobia bacterium RIFOXYB2_FULL_49_7]
MSRKTKGQIEAEISEAIIQFEKEYMGRGPLTTKTHLMEDVIFVRLKGVLTKAEHQLALSNDFSRGQGLIKTMRSELLEKGRPLLEVIINDITGKKVVSLHTDISTATGERIIVFILNAPLDFTS